MGCSAAEAQRERQGAGRLGRESLPWTARGNGWSRSWAGHSERPFGGSANSRHSTHWLWAPKEAKGLRRKPVNSSHSAKGKEKKWVNGNGSHLSWYSQRRRAASTLDTTKKPKPKNGYGIKAIPKTGHCTTTNPAKDKGLPSLLLHIAMAMHVIMQFFPRISSSYLHYFGLLELPSQFFHDGPELQAVAAFSPC